MRRTLIIGVSAALAAASLTAVVATSHGASSASAEVKSKLPNNPTMRIAGLQHFCGSQRLERAPSRRPPGMSSPVTTRPCGPARASCPYIGHDEPAALFYSNKPGAGSNVS